MRAKGTGVAPARCKTAERQAKSGEIKSCLLQVRVAAADKGKGEGDDQIERCGERSGVLIRAVVVVLVTITHHEGNDDGKPLRAAGVFAAANQW